MSSCSSVVCYVDSDERMSRSSSLPFFWILSRGWFARRASGRCWSDLISASIRVHLRLEFVRSRPFAVVSRLLRPRMGLIVRLLQSLNRDMRINLRRRKALVAKQGLNAAKIGAVL